MSVKPNMWRVDVEGVAVYVYGETAYEHLQKVNHKIAKMKLALHKIKGGHSEDPHLDAIRALAQ